jgi:hypothetical protein
MKNTTVQITYPAEKLDAVRQYMGKKDADIDAELGDALAKLYEKYVPRDVREFLEVRESALADKPKRPRRSDRQAAAVPSATALHSQQEPRE